MVTVRRQSAEAGPDSDLAAWLASVAARCHLQDTTLLERACERARGCEKAGDLAGRRWPYGIGCYRIGLEMAEILADLHADGEALPAAVLYRAVREGHLSLLEVEREFGETIARMVEGVLRMAAISAVLNPSRKPVLGQQEGQLDNVRKMLVAMVDDVRVALLKLAERTVIIRAVKDSDESHRQKVAREIFDIYAPLAHRLGVGQLKWELEDLSFRYLQPGAYKKIARLLDEKRLDREEYIAQVVEEIKGHLARSGIEDVQVDGRAKHIYSIWRKMQKKHLDFYEVYDVRAVRILVPEVRDCYAALGVVHSLWQHVPTEFDDYIATPKENGYQSLHTAVVGPDRKMLEVQIRTYEMHDDAELGVCAHWHYKEGPRRRKGQDDQKIAWLRQVLEWHDELGEASLTNLVDDLRAQHSSERVYVFTPEGHVVDLEAGATPVDFAYQVHTEVGHRCRGAKVNGHIVPLHYRLKTGEQVEILTTREGGPSRDWLTASLGYVRTSSARARIQQWFKRQDRSTHISQGRAILERELSRLAVGQMDLDKLAPRFNLKGGEDVLAALGAGDLRPASVVNHLQGLLEADTGQQELEFIPRKAHKRDEGSSDITIEGVGNLMTHIAACCQPLPGDSIMGYITQGRGVTVHRADCPNLLAMQADDPLRVIEVSWGHADRISYPVDIFVRAWDRQGLLRDLLSVLANERVNVTAAHTESHQDDNTATMLLTIEISTLGNLGKVLARMDQLPGVLEVRRYKN
ncbi:GTP diphosphokinase [Alcanivorax quisquiliarum]|uniref:GTP pyrophosphokinase n=1 Tax=Alcanivorax quisquiliarum TaxID=2933565 RepID=A0ABT0E7E3_9GAMM|nr:GTP diphosphokinase [Alcanivorax quisquiliarum]MCK0537692.1 GTP diphosphokinase [Alcanivorax quisquiliarum]